MAVDVIVIVRGARGPKADFSLHFALPAVPSVGDYISIDRVDECDSLAEDLIVRRVGWRLFHPAARGAPGWKGAPQKGVVKQVFVECSPAVKTPFDPEMLRGSGQLIRRREAIDRAAVMAGSQADLVEA